MKASTLAALLIVTIATPAALNGAPPQGVSVPKGAYDGLTYRQLSEHARAFYVSGLWDGFLMAPAFGGDEKLAKALHECFVQITQEQLLAIVDKYLADHPERWQWDMHGLALAALDPVCPAYSAESTKYWHAKGH